MKATLPMRQKAHIHTDLIYITFSDYPRAQSISKRIFRLCLINPKQSRAVIAPLYQFPKIVQMLVIERAIMPASDGEVEYPAHMLNDLWK
jgi:hypothetical protein